MSNSGARIKYGNWLSSAPGTIWGLPPFGLVIGGMGVVLTLAQVVFGAWGTGLLTLLLTALFLLFFAIRFGEMDAGRTIATRLADRMDHKKRVLNGETQYITGLLSALPNDALTALPGPLADIEELNGVDGAGQPYTLLHHKAAGSIAATFVCAPDGTALQPQEQIDSQVSKFGGWVASLSKDSAIAGGMVVVDSALSSSEPLREKIRSEVSDTAPEVARRALLEAASLMPGRVSMVDAYATVVWNRAKLDGDVESAAAEIAARLPDHRASIYAAGGGQADVAVSEDLARMVSVAYRPQRTHEYGTDDLAGHVFHTRLTEAGPEFFDDTNGRVVFHDGVASMSVMMLVPPRMHITETTMQSLFAPSEKFLRKRVAVFYRPLSGAQAVKRAQNLRRGAGFTASSGKGQTSTFDKHKVKLAEKTEGELVEGASMTRFMVMVTVTFEPTEKAWRDATTKVKSLLDECNLAYRFVEHGSAAAFHTTLPLGVLPWLYRGPFALWMEGKL